MKTKDFSQVVKMCTIVRSYLNYVDDRAALGSRILEVVTSMSAGIKTTVRLDELKLALVSSFVHYSLDSSGLIPDNIRASKNERNRIRVLNMLLCASEYNKNNINLIAPRIYAIAKYI